MAQDYGAAQPIADVFKKVYRAVSGTADAVPTPEKKVDTSWHDDEVKKANESFKAAAEKRKVGGAEGKTGTTQKKTGAKKTLKRVAGTK